MGYGGKEGRRRGLQNKSQNVVNTGTREYRRSRSRSGLFGFELARSFPL